MKTIKLLSRYSFFLICLFFYRSEAQGLPTNTDITLVASTPGDEQIKAILGIPSETKIDFIKWSLVLNSFTHPQHKFSLNIVFGESQPNTLGFKKEGETKLAIEGEYVVSRKSGSINGEIYHLKSSKLSNEILMLKLSENVFHLITAETKLMVGNGGWSYTLNRKEPIKDIPTNLTTLLVSSDLPSDTSKQIIFDGRTPCMGFAEENVFAVVADCFKLKWKLVLNKDPKTLLPTTYSLRRVFGKEREVVGKWSIIKGITSNKNAIIYQLDPDQPHKSISLLLGDENVAFFLNKNNQLYTGNEHFSYTLNKRK